MARLGLEEIRYQARRRGKKIILNKNELRRYIDEAEQTLAKDSIIDLIIRDFGVDITLNRVEDSMIVDNITEPISAKDSSLDSKFLSKGPLDNFSVARWPDLQVESLKKLAEENFESIVIIPSEKREEETTRHFTQQKKFDINGKKQVLQFFNGTPENPKEFDLNRVAEMFATKLSGESTEKNKNLNNRLTKFVAKSNLVEQELLQEMRSGVINAMSFIGFVEVLSRDQKKIIPDKSQSEKGGKTVLEYIEKINLEKNAAKLLAGRSFTLESAGSAPVGKLLTKELQQTINSTGFITQQNIEQAITKAIAEDPSLIERFVGRDINKMSSTAYAQKFMSGSGSGQDVKVADLKAVLDGREIFIDVKMSKDQGGRYTPSTGITTNIEKILSSMDSPINTEFLNRLQIVMSFMLFLAYHGLLKNEQFRNQDFVKLLTYGLLGSKEFTTKFRAISSTDSVGFVQPDFLLTSAGYMWYSDFFKIVRDVYFTQSGGRLATIAFKNELKITTNENGETVTRNTEFRDLTSPLLQLKEKADTYETFIKLLKENNLEHWKKYVNLFSVTKVNLSIDIKNLYSRLKP